MSDYIYLVHHIHLSSTWICVGSSVQTLLYKTGLRQRCYRNISLVVSLARIETDILSGMTVLGTWTSEVPVQCNMEVAVLFTWSSTLFRWSPYMQ